MPPTLYLLIICQSGGGKTQAFSNFFAKPIKRIQEAKRLPNLVYQVMEFSKTYFLTTLNTLQNIFLFYCILVKDILNFQIFSSLLFNFTLDPDYL